jgi:hypothetical protein
MISGVLTRLLTDNTLFVADHVPSDFRLVNLFIADLLGAFLHSEFMLSHDNSSNLVKSLH